MFYLFQILTGMASIIFSCAIAYLLILDTTSWSVLSTPLFALLGVTPLVLFNIWWHFHRRSLKTASSIKKLSGPLATIIAYVLIVIITQGYILFWNTFDNCSSSIGEGIWFGRHVVIASCQTAFHESEETLQLYGASWERKFYSIGYSGEEDWAQPIIFGYSGQGHLALPVNTISPSDLFPHSENEAVFHSPPQHAKITNNILNVRFEDNEVREVNLSTIALNHNEQYRWY